MSDNNKGLTIAILILAISITCLSCTVSLAILHDDNKVYYYDEYSQKGSKLNGVCDHTINQNPYKEVKIYNISNGDVIVYSLSKFESKMMLIIPMNTSKKTNTTLCFRQDWSNPFEGGEISNVRVSSNSFYDDITDIVIDNGCKNITIDEGLSDLIIDFSFNENQMTARGDIMYIDIGDNFSIKIDVEG